jgi:hypothetical protein
MSLATLAKKDILRRLKKKGLKKLMKNFARVQFLATKFERKKLKVPFHTMDFLTFFHAFTSRTFDFSKNSKSAQKWEFFPRLTGCPSQNL